MQIIKEEDIEVEKEKVTRTQKYVIRNTKNLHRYSQIKLKGRHLIDGSIEYKVQIIKGRILDGDITASVNLHEEV